MATISLIEEVFKRFDGALIWCENDPPGAKCSDEAKAWFCNWTGGLSRAWGMSRRLHDLVHREVTGFDREV